MQAAHFAQSSVCSLDWSHPSQHRPSSGAETRLRLPGGTQAHCSGSGLLPPALLQKLTTGTGLHAGDSQPRHTRGTESWERRDPIMSSLNFSNTHLHLLSLLCQQPLQGTEHSCLFRSGACTDFG